MNSYWELTHVRLILLYLAGFLLGAELFSLLYGAPLVLGAIAGIVTALCVTALVLLLSLRRIRVTKE
jgi:hypothetical protein